jgi:SAM domain (Sterile alpha motif)
VLRVEDWLASLGMSEYAERFADNDIDAGVLRDLSLALNQEQTKSLFLWTKSDTWCPRLRSNRPKILVGRSRGLDD